MRNRFELDAPIDIPDGSSGGAASFVIAEGLATVDTDVEIEGYILHPDVSQLRVTLTNPAGTEVVLFDGETGGEELILDVRSAASRVTSRSTAPGPCA
jgi:subtilisin-like proprotein convertase family protein